eukprot:CAMPEP_0204602852 /NCGR_PEP_ID=MMETSP0661-20131031/56909_1 /ASSEMBLY_ACC=CAM_ASM_000606 /TAXON_ID=109239 /ORGANISM="Alexandrium margalefi, Strain AMGDE01CS-322" /LENGTH=165 /DNA_ID=CAMNT_0051613865 /DNA_START=43 /DNA_END=536 /DNA_ORIENTATION=-
MSRDAALRAVKMASLLEVKVQGPWLEQHIWRAWALGRLPPRALGGPGVELGSAGMLHEAEAPGSGATNSTTAGVLGRLSPFGALGGPGVELGSAGMPREAEAPDSSGNKPGEPGPSAGFLRVRLAAWGWSPEALARGPLDDLRGLLLPCMAGGGLVVPRYRGPAT